MQGYQIQYGGCGEGAGGRWKGRGRMSRRRGGGLRQRRFMKLLLDGVKFYRQYILYN